MDKNSDGNTNEATGAKRVKPMVGDVEEATMLKYHQDGRCSEGGCEHRPTHRFEERFAHGWRIADLLCSQHAEEWSYRYGLDRS